MQPLLQRPTGCAPVGVADVLMLRDGCRGRSPTCHTATCPLVRSSSCSHRSCARSCGPDSREDGMSPKPTSTPSASYTASVSSRRASCQPSGILPSSAMSRELALGHVKRFTIRVLSYPRISPASAILVADRPVASGRGFARIATNFLPAARSVSCRGRGLMISLARTDGNTQDIVTRRDRAERLYTPRGLATGPRKWESRGDRFLAH